MNIPAEIEQIKFELTLASAGTHIVIEEENSILDLLDDIHARIREYNRAGKPNPHSASKHLKADNEYVRDIFNSFRY